MKATPLPNVLLAVLALLLLLLACRKEVLPRKSFPRIETKAEEISKSEVLITFNIFDVEVNDSLQEKRVFLAPTLRYPDSSVTVPITRDDNFVIIKNLQPKTNYTYKIQVLTTGVQIDGSTTDTNLLFESDTVEFQTPSLTLLLDTLLGFEKQMRFEAFGLFDDYDPNDLVKIRNLGHEWHNLRTNQVTTSIAGNPSGSGFNITEGGLFKSKLHFFDPTVPYAVRSFIDFAGETVYSNADTIALSDFSNGDFWVDLATIKGVRDNREIANGLEEVPELEGAISFVLKDYAYVGLGRKADKTYNKTFYRYNPTNNIWDSLSPPFPGTPRMLAVSFVDANTDLVYFGTGCNPCEGDPNISTYQVRDLNDFYSFDGQSFVRLSDLGSGRFGAYGFSRNGTPYLGGGAKKGIVEGDRNNDGEIDSGEWHDLNGDGLVTKSEWDPTTRMFADHDGDMKHTAGEWQDHNEDHYIQIGEWIDDGNGIFDPGEWDDNGDGVFDAGEWKDENRDGVFDTGEWEDKNRDGVFDTGEWEDDGDGIFAAGEWKDVNMDTIFDTGEWMDNGDTVFFAGEWEDDGDGVFAAGEWKDENSDGVFEAGEWKDDGDTRLEISTDCFWRDNNRDKVLDLSEVNCNVGIPIPLKFEEWMDQNGNDKIDLGDECIGCFNNDDNIIDDSSRLTFEVMVLSDFGSLGNTVGNQQQRYGAAVIQQAADTYLIGGNIRPNPQKIPLTITICKLNTSNNSWDCNPHPGINSRVFPFTFAIGNKGYFGAGEQSAAESVGFDLWALDSNGDIQKATSCGLSDLSRGISFSFNGKGYVGFGRTDEQVSKEFWVYIPCLAQNGCN